jgi:integrase
MTPHQFRHVVAKIHLDANPSALHLVADLLDHKSLRSARRFYAGIDTLRAGRAHAELVMQIRESTLRRRRRRRTPRNAED